MKLIIISGRSGSGKSTCLHVLEDLGFYCVDNIPASLLSALVKKIYTGTSPEFNNVAVSIDARNISGDLQQFPDIFKQLDNTQLDRQVIFLDADSTTLLKRFSETRRKHPLSNSKIGLMEAIQKEQDLLEPIAGLASLKLDTSTLSLHELRDIIKTRVAAHDNQSLALQFQSFGFRKGLPADADIVYDVRCLPNPYWISHLRSLTGQDKAVIDYLESQPEVQEMFTDIKTYLERWLPRFAANNRSYVTVAIGCTGGQHRSVFLCEKLNQYFSAKIDNIQVRHKDLS